MDADQLVKPLILKDLRVQLRARGCSPAGGIDDLRQRLKDNMTATGNYSINLGDVGAPVVTEIENNFSPNNYQRRGGMQNVGNKLTDRPSSRVLAPPGGGSQIQFGDHVDPYTQRGGPQPTAPQQPPLDVHAGPPAPAPTQQPEQAYGSSSASVATGNLSNNYVRPGGQNVGNFLTDRPSSKVLAPPGGKSQITFG